MNNTQHTPGPWDGNTKNPLGTHIYAKGKHVAIVDNEEDAPLIAAAPELLEGLDLLLCFGIEMRDDEEELALLDARDTARAALAKAKGEQPNG